MLIVAFVFGALLGVVVSALLWATGRRPYLRVDFERHETRQVVHHLVHDTDRARPPLDPQPTPTRQVLNQTPPAVVPARITATDHVTDRKDTQR